MSGAGHKRRAVSVDEAGASFLVERVRDYAKWIANRALVLSCHMNWNIWSTVIDVTFVTCVGFTVRSQTVLVSDGQLFRK